MLAKMLFQLTITAVLLSVSLLSVNAFADVACRRDCEPPTLGVTYEGDRVIENGFTINGQPFNVDELSQTLPTTKVRTGELVKIQLKVFENSGTPFLRDTSLSIGNYKDDVNGNPLATISFKQNFVGLLRHDTSQDSDVSKTSVIDDPNGLLKDITVKATEIDTYRMVIDISFKVTKLLDTSDIAVQTTDAKRGNKSNVFYDAIKVTGKSIIEEKPQLPVNNVLPPLKQIKKSHSTHVECRQGFELVMRSGAKLPSCVSTYTAEMLREHGMVTSN